MSELNEDPASRARRYIASLTAELEKTSTIQEDIVVNRSNIDRVTDAIRRYLQDARHYLDQGRATTSLASVAYAEGLLDALTFLELAQPRIKQ
jgi:FAD synthetase